MKESFVNQKRRKEMLNWKPVGPFDQATINAQKFVNNFQRLAVFQSLLEELEEIKKSVENSETEEEKMMAELMYSELEKTLTEMISFGKKDEESRRRQIL